MEIGRMLVFGFLFAGGCAYPVETTVENNDGKHAEFDGKIYLTGVPCGSENTAYLQLRGAVRRRASPSG